MILINFLRGFFEECDEWNTVKVADLLGAMDAERASASLVGSDDNRLPSAARLDLNLFQCEVLLLPNMTKSRSDGFWGGHRGRLR